MENAHLGRYPHPPPLSAGDPEYFDFSLPSWIPGLTQNLGLARNDSFVELRHSLQGENVFAYHFCKPPYAIGFEYHGGSM